MTRATVLALACGSILASPSTLALAAPAPHHVHHAAANQPSPHSHHAHGQPGRDASSHGSRSRYGQALALRRGIRWLHHRVERLDGHAPALALGWNPAHLREQRGRWQQQLSSARHRQTLRVRAAVSEARAVEVARSFLGVPYAWGGASRSGTDCSGLTMQVYARLGVRLDHYTGTQWHAGPRVPRSGLRAGDLVFFDGSSVPAHVGIYAGGGRFIHAPHTGTVVKVAPLASMPGYVGAVRPPLPR